LHLLPDAAERGQQRSDKTRMVAQIPVKTSYRFRGRSLIDVKLDTRTASVVVKAAADVVPRVIPTGSWSDLVNAAIAIDQGRTSSGTSFENEGTFELVYHFDLYKVGLFARFNHNLFERSAAKTTFSANAVKTHGF
jgi:hypothetical protein